MSDYRNDSSIFNIVTILIPPNCTDKLQPLDLSINKPMKNHLKSKFQTWYANEVRKQLKTTAVQSIKVEVNLAVVKNPSANWIITAWNELEKSIISKASANTNTRLYGGNMSLGAGVSQTCAIE